MQKRLTVQDFFGVGNLFHPEGESDACAEGNAVRQFQSVQGHAQSEIRLKGRHFQGVAVHGLFQAEIRRNDADEMPPRSASTRIRRLKSTRRLGRTTRPPAGSRGDARRDAEITDSGWHGAKGNRPSYLIRLPCHAPPRHSGQPSRCCSVARISRIAPPTVPDRKLRENFPPSRNFPRWE